MAATGYRYMGIEKFALGSVHAADWSAIAGQLDQNGHALIDGMLEPQTCVSLAELYRDGQAFRSRVVMARHNFGRGEYRYFSYPLPPLVQALRESLYERLVGIANDWQGRLGIDYQYPATHQAFIQQCHELKQTRPTPLLLRYGQDDYNCLHQDLYGELAFPLQAVVLLSRPGDDFDGGELVLTEQRPRMQSRPMVLSLGQGDMAVFPVHHRPVQGTRGHYRVNMRHGVSLVKRGHRHTLGIIFHDAQ